MSKLFIEWQRQKYEHNFEGKISLIDGIRASGAQLALPCGGNHTCGKCKVLMHNPPLPAKQEALLLTPQELARGVRLACFITLSGDESVVIEHSSAMQQIRSAGHLPSFTPDPAADNHSYGFAVDIGTTTVVTYLYRLGSSQLLDSCAARNSQGDFGGDVISRIQHTITAGVAPLQKAICTQLQEMFAQCMQRQAISSNQIKSCVITGNTTMLHLLAGLDPSGIAHTPFVPNSLFGHTLPPHQPELGLPCPVYLPRCAGAYLGADVTCAVLAAEMAAESAPALLVDIGTNGEMVLAKDGRFWGCSAAAGPAFEGAGISQGVSASAGAIDRVFVAEDKVCYTTIGSAPAVGICGSGLLDAVAVMLQTGALDETGFLVAEEPFAIGDSGVQITQEDIRQIQLAKAAIAAGIETLLAECGSTPEELGRFYLSGGFGSYLNVRSAAAIGLLPSVLADKTVVLGNAAGSGAAVILLSQQMQNYSEQLGAGIEEISLSTSARFMESYVEQMLF